jgi:M6 family metalloprotease-like protein
MNQVLAVLLLQMADQTDVPVDPDYARRMFTNQGRGTGNLVDYFEDVSHGRIDIGASQVFGWLSVPHTSHDLEVYRDQVLDEETKRLQKANEDLPVHSRLSDQVIADSAFKVAHSSRRAKIKQWAREAVAGIPGPDLASSLMVAVFNPHLDYFGSPDGVVVGHNPANPERYSIDLSGVAHEVGHGFGLGHSWSKGTEYGDKWDIMSYVSVRYNHANSLNPDPNRPYHTYGPGLNAVNMSHQGWLDQTRVHGDPDTGSWSIVLRPLHRRDLQGPLVAQVDDLWIEFRMNEHWDSAIGDPVVLLHRADRDQHGRPCSDLEASLTHGEEYTIGNELNLDSDHIRIRAEIDPVERSATVRIARRAAKRLEPAIPFGSPDAGGGRLYYLPGRGWVRIPPRSPILKLMDRLVEVEQLQSLTAAPGQRVVLDGLATEMLRSVSEELTELTDARNKPRVPSSGLRYEQ